MDSKMKEHVWYDPVKDNFFIEYSFGFGDWLLHRDLNRIYLGEL